MDYNREYYTFKYNPGCQEAPLGWPGMLQTLKDDLERCESVLFLCSGNMIRSAFAELWARHQGFQRPVRSAGTSFRNRTIHPRTGQALLARGVDAAWVDGFEPVLQGELAADLRVFDGALAIGMTSEHLEALAPWPALARRSYLLSAVDEGAREVADPYFGGGWEGTFERIARCVESIGEVLDAGPGNRARVR